MASDTSHGLSLIFDAESVLGTLMLYPDETVDVVRDVLPPAAMPTAKYSAVLGAIYTLYARGEAPHAVNVYRYLTRDLPLSGESRVAMLDLTSWTDAALTDSGDLAAPIKRLKAEANKGKVINLAGALLDAANAGDMARARTLIEQEQEPDTTTTPSPQPIIYPDLPVHARMIEGASAGACRWLEEYEAFSRYWSPRAYEGFHRSVGLWVLSTVAARRVLLHLGGERFPSLYIALCARTSVWAKSTTARIGVATIAAAGLSHLLAADDATPQAFIRALVQRLPDKYDDLTEAEQWKATKKLAFAAQRGWWYEEFGQKVSAMMQSGGFMADFRGLLRRFDDCPPRYEYDSILRGGDVVEAPYLALLTNLTPADLKPYARKGSALWGDGFWARFAFVTPPDDAERPRGRFPDGEQVIPAELSAPLRRWHAQLGIPEVEIEEDRNQDGEVKGHRLIGVEPLQPQRCTLGAGVFEAFYTYNDALLDIVATSRSTDLDGNYARFAEKAMRVAMLAASLENDGRIEMRHWALGQETTEQWRRELHQLVSQLATEITASRESELEDQVTSTLLRLGEGTLNDLRRYVYGAGLDELTRTLDSLEGAGVVSSVLTRKKSKKYRIVGDQNSLTTNSREGEKENRREYSKSSTIDQANGRENELPGTPYTNGREIEATSTVLPIVFSTVQIDEENRGIYKEPSFNPFTDLSPSQGMILRRYLASQIERDHDRARELCEKYGIDYDEALAAVQK